MFQIHLGQGIFNFFVVKTNLQYDDFTLLRLCKYSTVNTLSLSGLRTDYADFMTGLFLLSISSIFCF